MQCESASSHLISISAFVGAPYVSSDLLTILLVEDEAFVRNVTAEVLRSFGYRVLMAANALEAKEAFAKHGAHVQLVLTDMIMPGSNGRKLAMELRKASPGLRVIVTSGYPESVVQDDSAADLQFLPKPFSVDSLIRKIREVTSREICA